MTPLHTELIDILTELRPHAPDQSRVDNLITDIHTMNASEVNPVTRAFNAVRQVTGLRRSEVCADSRVRCNVDARRLMAMALREHHTLKQIGRIIGGRDHATVRHSILVGYGILDTDEHFAAQWDKVKAYMERK